LIALKYFVSGIVYSSAAISADLLLNLAGLSHC